MDKNNAVRDGLFFTQCSCLSTKNTCSKDMLYLCNSTNIPEADSLLKERDISEYDLSKYKKPMKLWHNALILD